MDFLFLGLGNPPKYRGTRHNVGKDLIEGLLSEEAGKWHTVAKGRVGSLLLGPHQVACMVSDGYMNNTGQDMQDALLEIDPTRLVVVHDEVDLPVGSIRLSYNKSPGGHNGVASVAEALGTNAYFRLRIGVGKGDGDLKEYVLEKIPPSEMSAITNTVRTTLPEIILNQLPEQVEQVAQSTSVSIESTT